MPAVRRSVALAAAGMLALTACSNSQAPINRTPNSGSATASTVAGKQTITLLVGDDYRFRPSTFYVHPGEVTVVLKHVGTGAPHDFSVTGIPGDYVPLVSGGQTKSATFMTPSPGTYPFVCTIHVRQGQTGKMIVLRG